MGKRCCATHNIEHFCFRPLLAARWVPAARVGVDEEAAAAARPDLLREQAQLRRPVLPGVDKLAATTTLVQPVHL